MKLFLDSAITEEIEFAIDHFGINGVTTNPRHVQVSGKPFLGVIREIGALVQGTDVTVSVEVNPHYTDYDDIVKEAEKLAALSENFVIKLQCMESALKAIPYLKKQGVRVNFTLVFSSVQALFAMRAGAFYVSPFIGWKETNGEAVEEYVRECVAIRDNYNFDTEIIVAAVRNGRQIANAAVAGADIVTAGLQVYRDALDHPYTRDGIQKFSNFWDQTQYE
jgi:6-deoxy-6-sulfo-D-fructose transaldolase